jgi:hydrogenase nickel incorporation protein HypA/HybF
MHELTICQNIIEIINKEIVGKAVSKIKTIYLEIGEFALIEISALVFSFELLAKGTPMESAILDVKMTRGAEIYLKSMEII